jgi:hypothetical protein
MAFLLSFWLALVFIVGRLANIPQLLVWGVGLGAIFAWFGGMISPLVSPAWRLAGPIALSLGLTVLSGVALSIKTPPWLPFCVLIGTFCFIGVTIAEALWAPRNRGTMAPADS